MHDDIDDYVESINNIEEEIDNVKVVKHDLFTNGIGYLRLYFNTKNVPQKLIPYLGLLAAALGKVNTKQHSYQDLTTEINANTGGINSSMTVVSLQNNDLLPLFTFTASSLFEKSEFVKNGSFSN